MILLGGGPSIDLAKDQYLIGKRVVLGSSHDYVLKNICTPDIAVFMDPTETFSSMIKCPNPDVTYYVASQCDPALFDLLLDNNCNVIVWNNDSGLKGLSYGGGIIIGGGCTVATRALYIGVCMGYRNFDLYGVDSSLIENRNHPYFHPADVKHFDIQNVKCGEKYFQSTTDMLAQAIDFYKINEKFGDKWDLNFVGPGLLSTMFERDKNATSSSSCKRPYIQQRAQKFCQVLQ